VGLEVPCLNALEGRTDLCAIPQLRMCLQKKTHYYALNTNIQKMAKYAIGGKVKELRGRVELGDEGVMTINGAVDCSREI